MIIIIEGPDKCGKSTLARFIADKYSAELTHCAKPKTDNPFMEYFSLFARLSKGKHYVFDRAHLGEYVYSNLWRGGCKVTQEQFDTLDHLLMSKSSVFLIYAHADLKTIESRCLSEGEELLKPYEITRCLELFREAIVNSILPKKIYYNSAKMSTSDIMNELDRVISCKY